MPVALMMEESGLSSDPAVNMDEMLKKIRGQLFVKRLFDIFFSILGLVLLLPLFLLVAVVIKADSKGPVFFKQMRVGKNGRQFVILKFRTMIADAERRGLSITVGNDNRITKVGHILRKYKIDELPQLINVLIGNMSFVGPRPEVPKYVAYYNSEQMEILKVKPGITDYASICFINENEMLSTVDDPEEIYVRTIMPIKIRKNRVYLLRISILNDLRLILLTIHSIFRKNNNSSNILEN